MLGGILIRHTGLPGRFSGKLAENDRVLINATVRNRQDMGGKVFKNYLARVLSACQRGEYDRIGVAEPLKLDRME